MDNLFGNLSYSKKELSPNLEPVKEIEALMKQKQLQYDFVKDNQNVLNKALNNIPYIEGSSDAENIIEAKKLVEDTYGGYKHNLEDNVLETKNLIANVDSNFGLTKIQANAKSRQEQINALYKSGATDKAVRAIVQKANRDYTGVYKDDVTGMWRGSWSAEQGKEHIAVPEKLVTLFKGFKSNKYLLPTADGRMIHRTADGQFKIDRESVDEKEILKAGLHTIDSDDEMKEQFDRYARYDIELEKNGEDVTVNDIKNDIKQNGLDPTTASLLGIKYNAVTKKYDATDYLKSLEDKKPNELYGHLHNIKSTRDKVQAVQPAMYAHGFVKDKYTTIDNDDIITGKKLKDLNKDLGDYSLTLVDNKTPIDPKETVKLAEDISNYNISIRKLQDANEKMLNSKNYSQEDFDNNKLAINTQTKELERLQTTRNRLSKKVEKSLKDKVDFTQLYQKYYQSAIKNIFNRMSEADELLLQEKQKEATKALKSASGQEERDKIMKELRDFKQKALNKYKENYIKDFDTFRNEATELALANAKDWRKNKYTWDPGTGANSDTNIYYADISNFSFNGEYSDIINNVARNVAYNLDYNEDSDSVVINPRASVYRFDIQSLKPLQEFHRKLKEDFKKLITRNIFKHKGMSIDEYIADNSDLKNYSIDPESLQLGSDGDGSIPVYATLVSSEKNEKPISIALTIDDGITQQKQRDYRRALENSIKEYLPLYKQNALDATRQEDFEELALSLFETTPDNKAINDAKLYSLTPGEEGVPIKFSNGGTLKIKATHTGEDTLGKYGFKISGINNNKEQIVVKTLNNNGVPVFKFEPLNPLNKGQGYTFRSVRHLKKFIGTQVVRNSIKGSTPINSVSDLSLPNDIDFNTLIQIESAGDPNAISNKGAIGKAQIMPLDAKGGSPLPDYNAAFNTNYTDEDLFDADINKKIGKWYLETEIPRMLRENNLPLTTANKLISYNHGIGNLKKWIAKGSNFNDLHPETQDYLKKFSNNYAKK